MNAAWDDGIRYFDTAPLYGAGLAEIRMGTALAGRPRSDYVISTKVGRLILDEIENVGVRDLGEKGDVFKYGRPNKIVNDYSRDATLRSIEESLKRLGTSHIDIVFVHDVAQDFYGDEWLSVFESARKGAFNTLDRLRDEGVIKAWGLGVNRVEPIELLLALEEPRPDGFLLAGRYTLLDHSRALQRVIPMIAEHELAIVVGGPYSSGALVGGPNFEYAPAPPGNHRQGEADQGDRRPPRRQPEGGWPAVRVGEPCGGCRHSRSEPSRPHCRGPRSARGSHSRRLLARATLRWAGQPHGSPPRLRVHPADCSFWSLKNSQKPTPSVGADIAPFKQAGFNSEAGHDNTNRSL